ncbi:transcriptional regulator, TetR family [Parafrankia sp. EAN1pec]|uniref:TetR/AcrR family transcriptional regulator n=1 Tax=Parafrankia sp. (strain EAN1pec) TaxID=298653 RepID=UPI000054449B|nr:transcriptional regulator, TetR family [Frankia sp. EAN1pec]
MLVDAAGRQAQARENRARAIGAATELFVRQGFAATSMAQIAAAAGVSTPTVFTYFSSKINLLRVAVDEAVAGDDEPVALHERPAIRAVHDGATAGEVLGAFAVAATEIAQRAFPLLSALRRAADVDPQAGELARPRTPAPDRSGHRRDDRRRSPGHSRRGRRRAHPRHALDDLLPGCLRPTGPRARVVPRRLPRVGDRRRAPATCAIIP